MRKIHFAFLIALFLGLGYFFGEITREGRDEKVVLQKASSDVSENLLERKFQTFDDNKVFLPLADNPINVLNFWATWCPPCKKEIPIFNKKYLEESGKGIGIIGIAMDEEDQIEDFVSLQPIKYPNFFGNQDVIKLMGYYGNKEGVLPYTVLTDNNGKYLNSVTGELSYERLSKLIIDASNLIERR